MELRLIIDLKIRRPTHVGGPNIITRILKK